MKTQKLPLPSPANVFGLLSVLTEDQTLKVAILEYGICLEFAAEAVARANELLTDDVRATAHAACADLASKERAILKAASARIAYTQERLDEMKAAIASIPTTTSH